jgi:hypothetical protein
MPTKDTTLATLIARRPPGSMRPSRMRAASWCRAHAKFPWRAAMAASSAASPNPRRASGPG